MKNRIWVGLALTLAVGFMLNACGGGGNNNAAVAPVGVVGPNGICPVGVNGYPGVGYNNGYMPNSIYPTTGYYGNTGLNYNYGYTGNNYWYTYSYGNNGFNQWNNPGFGNPGFGNIPGTGYPNQFNNPYNYNNYNNQIANAGCPGATAYNTGVMCTAQQLCTNMGQPGLVHYGAGCYPSCGACMASVNGQCLPGM